MTAQTAEPTDLATPAWEPTRPLDELHEHLTEALRALRGRRGDVDTFWAYHDGEHDQVWLNEGLRQAFGGRGMSDLQDNYCGMAVGAFLSRLNVSGWTPRRLADAETSEAKAAVRRAAAAWDDNDMQLEQDDVARAVFVAGSAYVLVWPRVDRATGQQAKAEGTTVEGAEGEDGGTTEGDLLWDVVAKDARNTYVATGAKQRQRKWGWVVWLDRDRWRATGYYSDADGKPAEVCRLHTTPTRNVSKNFPEQARRFLLDTDDPGGPMPEVFGGKCPLVPFKLERRGRSWLRDMVPGQDKINKLSANKMVTAEFLAFPQRYLLSDQDIPEGVLKYSPAKMLQLDPGGGNTDDGTVIAPTKVGEFSTADLEVYDKAIDSEVRKLFTIKLLPRHLQVNVGTPPSGEAIKADEGPHVGFVRNTCMTNLGASWADVQELMGNPVQPVWSDPEVANALAEAEELERLVRAGVPLLSALRKVGWDADEIEAVGGELEVLRLINERAAQAAALAAQQGRATTDVTVDDGLALDKRVTMAGVLIRSGYDPVTVTTALDLPPELVHTGALPTTVRTETEVEADEANKVKAAGGQAAPPAAPAPADDDVED